MAKRPFISGGAQEVRRLKKESRVVVKNLVRDLRRGNCHAAHGWMDILNRINGKVANQMRSGIANPPIVPSAGTFARIRRAYRNRCRVSFPR